MSILSSSRPLQLAIAFLLIAAAKFPDIAGDLTLHGVTRPMTLKAKFNAAGVNPLSKKYTVGFEVEGVLKRSDFGVDRYVPLVGDEVKLIVSAAFEKP
jgi:polyisoprenoid-binding protein YceI